MPQPPVAISGGIPAVGSPVEAVIEPTGPHRSTSRKSAAASQTGEARSFLDWLSFGGDGTTLQQTVQTTGLDELALTSAKKRPAIWEVPASLQGQIQVAPPVATTATSAVGATESTDAPDKTRSILADDLDSDDLDLLQKIVGAPNPAMMPWFLPQSLPVGQAWADTAGQAGTEAISANAGGTRLSGQMERLLKWSAASGKSVRVMIDDSLAVVLRIRQGRVSADFVPQGVLSQEVASKLAALQSQLDALRQRLSEQNLPVDDVRARLAHSFEQPNQSRQQPSGEPSEESGASS